MFGSKPIRIGASTVEPNIATTCWMPMAMVCGHGRRSSGATSPAIFSVHVGRDAMPLSDTVVLAPVCTAAARSRNESVKLV